MPKKGGDSGGHDTGSFSVEIFDKAYEEQKKQLQGLIDRTNKRAAVLNNTIKQKAAHVKNSEPAHAPLSGASRTIVVDMPREYKAPAHSPVSARGSKLTGAEHAQPSAQRRTAAKKPAKLLESDTKQTRLNPIRLGKYLNKLDHSLSFRVKLAVIFYLPLAYFLIAPTLGLPIPAPISYQVNADTNLLVQELLLAALMICGWDVISSGFGELMRHKPACSAAVTLSCIVTLLFGAMSALIPGWSLETEGVPFMLCASSLYISMLSYRWLIRAKARAVRDVKRLTHADTLFLTQDGYQGYPTFIRVRSKNIKAFYPSLMDEELGENAFRFFMPLAMAAALLVSCASAMLGGEAPLFRFVWSLSILTASLPSAGMLVASSLPYARISKRMSRSGAVAGGSRALSQFSAEAYAALSENELYPPGTIQITDYKLFSARDRETVISYVGSALSAIGCSMAVPFLAIIKDEFFILRRVSNLEFTGEIISADIEGHTLLMGEREPLLRAGFRIPEVGRLKAPLYVAIDAEMTAVFALNYKNDPDTEYALRTFIRNGRLPVITARDFHISAASVETEFNIRPGIVICPPIEVRVALANTDFSCPAEGVVLTRKSARSVAETVEGARRLRRASSAILLMGIIASAVALALASAMALNGWYSSATPLNLFLFTFLWSIPVWLTAAWAEKY